MTISGHVCAWLRLCDCMCCVAHAWLDLRMSAKSSPRRGGQNFEKRCERLAKYDLYSVRSLSERKRAASRRALLSFASITVRAHAAKAESHNSLFAFRIFHTIKRDEAAITIVHTISVKLIRDFFPSRIALTQPLSIVLAFHPQLASHSFSFCWAINPDRDD